MHGETVKCSQPIKTSCNQV